MSTENATYIKSHYRTSCRPARWGKRPLETPDCLAQSTDCREAEGGGTPQVLQLHGRTWVTCPAGENLQFTSLIPAEFGQSLWMGP